MTIRDLGRAVVQSLKPDGTLSLPGIVSTITIPQNTVTRITNLTQPGATVIPGAPTLEDKNKTGQLASSLDPNQQFANSPPFPNPLERFASYNYLWSMACLTPKQYNDPRSYRGNSSMWLNESYVNSEGKKTQSSIVFASAGRFDSNRSNTVNGQPEYYVDNFVMNTFVAATEKTGNSNAIAYSFDIIEPYSMGLLLQSMQTAAINAGWPSYLDNAPYLLKLEFLGYTDDGKIFASSDALARYWTVKLKKVKFSVNEGGSSYKVECVPYSHQGFSNTINQSFSDIAITGDTLKELLVTGPKSLASVLNNREKTTKAKEGGIPDKYEIVFPTDASDKVGLEPTQNASINKASAPPEIISEQNIGSKSQEPANYGDGPIGDSKNTMGFQPTSGGNFVSKLEGDVRDEKTGLVQRNKMTIDPKIREFKFAQGQTITEILTQCVLSSDYAKKAIDPQYLDETGHINWFRIDAQIQLLDFDIKRNDYAKRIIYRLVPFKVHSSIFKSPTAAPPGFQELRKIIAKQYNYIYTGLNNDLLKFDIDIDNMFYTGRPISPPSETANNQNRDINDSAKETKTETELQQGAAPGGLANTAGAKPVKPDPDAGLPPAVGGSGDVSTERRVADAFQNAFLKNSADLINLNIEILGDPYWLVDTGLGNYIADKGPNSQTNSDLTMNYEGSDVYIYITFRTPIEPNLGTTGQGGLYNFPKGEIVSPFSGIYKVTKCDNKFSSGLFTQTIRCIRMTGQPQDYVGKEDIAKAQTLLYKQPEAEKKDPTTFIYGSEGE